MGENLNIVLATLVALLPIMNPFSTSALFLGMTQGESDKERRRMARMGCIYAFFILVTFLVAGSLIMEFFGISIPGLRIAGGLMISRIGFAMLNPSEEKHTRNPTEEAIKKSDISFTPLAMPSLSGPGSIAVTIGLATTADGAIEVGLIAVGILVVCVISWIVLRGATSVVRLLGETGMNAMSRIMGFLLLCVGVQFIVNGVIGVLVEGDTLGRIVEAYRTVDR